jgi:hypothetical protein
MGIQMKIVPNAGGSDGYPNYSKTLLHANIHGLVAVRATSDNNDKQKAKGKPQ